MKRIITVLGVATLTVVMLLVLAGPVFAEGARNYLVCGPSALTELTDQDVTGTLCERTVFTPSGNLIATQQFKSDAQGKVLEGGAQQLPPIIVPSEQASHGVITPSGNATAVNTYHP